tara:strand:- start:527 stop:1948 length:1422 start_codon:yes stop_codon:yes gene_type:complete
MFTKKKIFKNRDIFFFTIIIISAFFLRIYNLNFEDYWFDEQASFWVADPSLTLNETLQRGKEFDQGTSIIFNLFLKILFSLSNYDPQVGRYLPFFFGLLSIPALSYLTYQIKQNKSYLLVGILSSINFYLISYSQEVRVYSFLFFISILSIILFFKLLETDNTLTKKYLYSFFYILFSLLGVCLHIFFFIIIFSQLLFLFLNFLFKKKKVILNILCVLSIPVLYILFMYEYLLLQLEIQNFWIQQVNLDFFYNFFFSRFFGSKIMGLIYLLVLIYLFYNNRKKIFNIDNKNYLLIFILVFSYALPLLFSLYKQPILIDRYIIFVLVPIFILISILILDIKNLKIRYFILTIILVSSLINNYIEIFERKKTKPEFNKIIEYISKSNTAYIITKANDDIVKEIVINYSKKTILGKKDNINFLSSNFDYSELKEIWFLCYKPINGFDCSPEPYSFSNWSKVDNAEFKLINAALFKK